MSGTIDGPGDLAAGECAFSFRDGAIGDEFDSTGGKENGSVNASDRGCAEERGQ